MDRPYRKVKRQKIDGANLEIKGLKHEIKMLENVDYKTGQSQSSKIVFKGQDSDCIVDDDLDGADFVEDCRQINNSNVDLESIEIEKENINVKAYEDDVLLQLSEIRSIDNQTQKMTKPLNISTKNKLPLNSLTISAANNSITVNKSNCHIQNDDQPIKSQLLSDDSSSIEVHIELIQKSESDKEIIENQMNVDNFNMETDVLQYSSASPLLSTSNVDVEELIENTDSDKEMDEFLSQIDLNLIENTEQTSQLKRKRDEEIIESWENIQLKQSSSSNTESKDLKLNENISNLESYLFDNKEGNKVFRFFWWDAVEIPSRPGCVFLFGKISAKKSNTFVSCCIVVKNIERRLFVLPRKFYHDLKTNTPTEKPVSMSDVHTEISKKLSKKRIQFRSRPVTKNYCFALENIPSKAEYLEVRYPADCGRISRDEMQGETYEHIFGINSNFLELFLLEQNIKGPSWLDLKNPVLVKANASFCKLFIECNNMRDISTIKNEYLPMPPLVVAAINIKVAANGSQNEIVMISCLSKKNYNLEKATFNRSPFDNHFCIITRPSGTVWRPDHNDLFEKYKATKLYKCESERELLTCFLAIFKQMDPDLIVGHDLIGCQLNELLHRLTTLKIGNWSQISKLHIKTIPKNIRNNDLCPGRLVCDLKILAPELIKARSYDLPTLCKTVLKIGCAKRLEVEQEELKHLYTVPDGLRKLIVSTMQDTQYTLEMVYKLNIIPLAVQITNATGFILSKTLLGGRSERIEYLLLHAFSQRDYIVPDKYVSTNISHVDKSHKKSQYRGGLVLDPKIGFYSTFVLLMDFNSLYPSIIQEYNICFTTMKNNDVKTAILPAQMKILVDSRRTVKSLMRNLDVTTDAYIRYDIRQMALKLTANSLYGCLGYKNSRFYAKPLAAKITEYGRNLLLNTKEWVENYGYEVIYGDTDSLMINTKICDYNQVMKIGYQIKKEVNRSYKLLGLDIDSVFQYLLLLKKKKYAAMTVFKNQQGELIYQQQIKGLDIVRRDWSQVTTKAGRIILNSILSNRNIDDKMSRICDYLSTLKEKLEQNQVPETELTFSRQLTKDPFSYSDLKFLPHVQVAQRYNLKNTGKRFRQGDTIYYLICDDGTNKPALQRAYSIDEYKHSDTLKIDMKYYLSQQIYPMVSRLCEPLKMITPVQIADLLGLEHTITKRYSRPLQLKLDNMDGYYLYTENTCSDTKPFVFKCIKCLHQNEISEPLQSNDRADGAAAFKSYQFDACQNKECNAKPLDYIVSIQNQLTLAIESYIMKCDQTDYVCNNESCANRTKTPPKQMNKRQQPVCECKNGVMYKEYDDKSLYDQLIYFLNLFDINKITEKPCISTEMQTAYDSLKEIVEKYLANSAYAQIDLGKLFTFLLGKRDDEQTSEDDKVEDDESEEEDLF